MQEQERLRQKCLHLDSQLVAVQTECQKEREVRFLHINVLMNWCVCMQCVHVPVCVCVCARRRSSCCVSSCGRVEQSYSSRQISALVWDLRCAIFCGAAPPGRIQSHTGWLM